MKLKTGIIFSILCGASLASAMRNGVRVIKAKSFDDVLKVGTQEAMTRWVKDNSIDLNTRCIEVEHYMVWGKTKYMYPIERVITRYLNSPTSLINFLTILIGQRVPIDGYDDFNPLFHAIGVRCNTDTVIKLYHLGADPQKKFGKDSTTPQERTHAILAEEKSKTRIPDKERIKALEQLLELFKGGRQNVIQHTNHTTAVQSNQNINNQPSKPMLFTVQQVAGIAAVSMLCGVGLRMAYDWSLSQRERDDDVDDPESVTPIA